ncbi:MAG: isoleucine--tRNA ligase [Saprospiraceae bacterium]|uniref:Isoleucine--tRNA ligase n=1 Tax=Candidatus Defluviibacterium haderslevense TaxID=2981993 RepID=A0A9D7XDK9_9BACT|nr:isoleucine--tRNA ligase [Candidatus Defluviibacterium haderslevense]
MYQVIKSLSLPDIDKEILSFWEDHKIFDKSVSNRQGAPTFVFYEGPPSANGKPGIHHVMGRAVKDIFCRYQTLIGKQVHRKGGWDTHGLPIELSVEKELGITKEDIGITISIEDYNAKCKATVMRYKNEWDDLTRKMGYWVDLDHPYMTFENEYIESVWYLLKEIFDKNLLYKGYTIQPYSPAAGTGLSSHEVNQPGCYREVKDLSAVALFQVDVSSYNEKQQLIFKHFPISIAAWTTTPWTLPSNTALAVGEKIKYCLVETWNPYTKDKNYIVMAQALVSKWFKPEHEYASNEELPEPIDKLIHYKILLDEITGIDLVGLKYEPLFNYARPSEGKSYEVISGDFVSTEDGTGIVHIAPSFGADDMRVAKKNGIGALTLVDKQGRFTDEVYDFAHEYVKEDYLSIEEKESEKIRLGLDRYLSVDERLIIKLKKEGKLLNAQKYSHNYPHCWRTDKPILYYPLDSWFINVTSKKDRLVELNKTINWKPESTGTGRFGNWLENLQDWNLSRSRFWGIPLPIWRNESGTVTKCIGSMAMLAEEINKANVKFNLKQTLPKDLHRPFIDEIVLVSDDGNEKLVRETDLIDVWFDSGAMPYAQIHYPFSGEKLEGKLFPADFIAEGVDQTRGWFYTLHAIAGLVFDSVAYKTVVSNGLVLDKNGEKMSKRKGNVVDPFETINTFGADAPRWYMVSNADPWENLKFDLDGIMEVRNKFFGTLFNTYNFFAIYANVDQFKMDHQSKVPIQERPELDQWIISKLQSLIKGYRKFMDDYEPTQAARLVEIFVGNDLSNWHVRLSRKRFWRTDSTIEKKAAFETLYECLYTVSQLIAPFAPFFGEWLYRGLTLQHEPSGQSNSNAISVHLTDLPVCNEGWIDLAMERRMELAQNISSLVLSLRKGQKIRVRQPLKQILIPIIADQMKLDIIKIEELIKAEVNIKEINFITNQDNIIVRKAKPNFRNLGKKLGKNMQAAITIIQDLEASQLDVLQTGHSIQIVVDGLSYEIGKDDVEIISEDIPGWLVGTSDHITVALDISITDALLAEGTARELINRIQNIRKLKDYQITDRIKVQLESHASILSALEAHKQLICTETLSNSIELVNSTFEEKMDLFEDCVLGYSIDLA